MNNAVTLSAPAKINLTLHVTGKRPDGYHTLRSVMQSISLQDRVTVRINTGTKGISVSCSDKSIPCDEKNTAFKAAEAFFRETGMANNGTGIHIEKHIPSGAGLGGGSADAAAALAGLNILYGTKLSKEKLYKTGAAAGADVPFCITGGTALCEGIGELITPLPSLPQCFILIGKGTAGVSTAEAYRRIDLLPEGAGYDFDTGVFGKGIKDIAEICSNDFELAADIPDAADIRSIMLKCGAEASAMTGSGSAVYGIFTSEEKACSCRNKLAAKSYFSELCVPLTKGAAVIPEEE